MPGTRWGAYLIELNFTYPGTKSRIELPSLETLVGRITDRTVPSLVTRLRGGISTEPDVASGPDIVSGGFVYRNMPAGLERTPSAIGTDPQTITSIASADIDGDGFTDLVVGFKENPTTPLKRSGVKVYINPGDGDFSIVMGVLLGKPDQETEAVTTVDMNGDGRPDIIAGNKNQVNKVYINRGDTVFTAGIDIGTETDDTTSVHAADVAGDARVDLIVGNRGSTSKVYTTTAATSGDTMDNTLSAITVTFASSMDVGVPSGGGTEDGTRAITAADLNGDSLNDLVVGNSLVANKVYLNPGSGDFGAVIPLKLGSDVDDTRSLVVSDFGSQRAIVVGNAGQSNRLYLVPGSAAGFPSVIGTAIGTEIDDTRSIAVADINMDTLMDVVVTNAGMAPKTYLNPGDPINFAAVVPTVSNYGPEDGSSGSAGTEAAFSVGLGDVDSNGFLDVIAGNQMFLNPGGTSAGDFTHAEPYGFAQLSEDVRSVAVADVDGDGDQDVVFGTSAAVLVYLNPTGSMDRYFRGSAAFDGVNPIVLTSGYESVTPHVVVLADLNSDGHPELVVGMAAGEANHYYINPGDGNFKSAVRRSFFGSSLNTRSITVIDLNADGFMDILTANDGRTNKVYLGSIVGAEYIVGPTEADAIPLGVETDRTFSLSVGDLNMDGILDVVAGNYGQTNKVYTGGHSTGGGVFPQYAVNAATTITVPGCGGVCPASTDTTRALIVADSDGDGWLDCIVGNDGEQNRVYYGDGTGGFKGAGAIGTAMKMTFGVVTGDLNNDGNLDAIAANFGHGTEVTLGVSVVTPFDMSAILEKRLQLQGLDFEGQGNEGEGGSNPAPEMINLDIIVGDPTYGTTNFHGDPESQCRSPSDPYTPVTVRFRIEFPLIICYTPECIILNPLEGARQGGHQRRGRAST